jgi:hypothetical protein
MPAPTSGRDSNPKEELRRAIRFPIHSEVLWTMKGARSQPISGKGVSVDFSSTGLAFKCTVPLPVGKRLDLSVDWPAMLDGRLPMKLSLRGKIVRVQDGVVSVEILAKEFRTARAKALRA